MKRKLQVFISSTYSDLQIERQAAVEAVLEAGHIPAGMELFAAGNESQLTTIRRWIKDSDVFMLILGGRYGSIEPKSGKSYIQLEYEHAAKLKKDLFAAVITDEQLNNKVKNEGVSAIERKHGEQLESFRSTVMSKMCGFFGDTKELKMIVFKSLNELATQEKLTGWIRAEDVSASTDDPLAIKHKSTVEDASSRQQISWTDMMCTRNEILNDVDIAAFNAIICCSAEGSIVAELLCREVPRKPPIFVGHRFRRLKNVTGGGKSRVQDFESLQSRYWAVETDRWHLFIPPLDDEFRTKKLLFVDDYARSGETHKRVAACIQGNGFPNIETLCLFVTESALSNGDVPDYWQDQIPDRFSLPYMDFK